MNDDRNLEDFKFTAKSIIDKSNSPTEAMQKLIGIYYAYAYEKGQEYIIEKERWRDSQ